MSDRRFFWDGTRRHDQVILTGPEAHHMQTVLRLKPGDNVVLCDGQGTSYHAKLVSLEDKEASLSLGDVLPEQVEPRLQTSLYLAYTKGERLDFAIQKAVEVGVTNIYLFESQRCITKYSPNKLERLSRIALEACKQSGRSRLVSIQDVGTFTDVLLHDKGNPIKLFCYENAMLPLRTALAGTWAQVCLLIGPEGGFTQAEAIFASKTGWQAVSLGKRILRAETAPIVALSIVLYESQDI